MSMQARPIGSRSAETSLAWVTWWLRNTQMQVTRRLQPRRCQGTLPCRFAGSHRPGGAR
jgi:hypothetical protein